MSHTPLLTQTGDMTRHDQLHHAVDMVAQQGQTLQEGSNTEPRPTTQPAPLVLTMAADAGAHDPAGMASGAKNANVADLFDLPVSPPKRKDEVAYGLSLRGVVRPQSTAVQPQTAARRAVPQSSVAAMRLTGALLAAARTPHGRTTCVQCIVGYSAPTTRTLLGRTHLRLPSVSLKPIGSTWLSSRGPSGPSTFPNDSRW